ncbi:string [Carabus blaptoides fortunei]
MLWQSINESCEVCQCSRLIKNTFQLTERYTGTNRSFSHRSDCTSSNYDADKENQHFGSPVKHDNEISLYGNTSPSTSTRCTSMMCSPSPKGCQSSGVSRQPMEEFDLNSQDSGYGTSFNDRETKIFNFAYPSNTVTRKTSDQFFDSPKSKGSSSSIFNSFSSGSIESMDDGFLELVDLDTVDDNTQLPCNFNSLISGSLKNQTPVSNNLRTRPSFRRSVSMKEGSTPKARSCLFKPSTPELFENRPFKRPEPPVDASSPVQPKRYKFNELGGISPLKTQTSSGHPRVQRSFSANEATIMSAVQRSSTDPDLIGDFSKPFCLPLITGRHQDLKSITAITLAELMRGKYEDVVASFKVVDCRYPYEYDGGHIGGALNLYTKEQIMAELVEIKRGKPSVETNNPKRHILVFHCEFSSERGPNLSRFLRNLDRTRNNDSYPALHYPEIYLLDGGYKSFYEQYAELCVPVAYKSMLDPAHERDLRHFRAKSKTWNADTRGRPQLRSSLKRLGFP